MRPSTGVFMLGFFFTFATSSPVLFRGISDDCGRSSGIPPSPRIILLGKTGTGKSTLGNRLLGNKPGLWGYNNKADLTFGVGHDRGSHTNVTSWLVGKWLGKEDGPCVTLIDTPGIGDTEGRDCEHADAVARTVKDLGTIDTFLLLLKSSDNRFSQDLQEQMGRFEEIFGKNMWNSAVIEFTFWKHEPNFELARLRTPQNEKKCSRCLNRNSPSPCDCDEDIMSQQWNEALHEHFDIKLTEPRTHIPTVFIDPVMNERYAKQIEMEKYTEETQKLWSFSLPENSFVCKDRCSTDGFLEGQPILRSQGDAKPVKDMTTNATREINMKLGEKLVIQWQIWFGDCENKNQRNYTIQLKNDSTGKFTDIFYMNDKYFWAFNATRKESRKLEDFPADADVNDVCSNENENNECLPQSKFKTVTLVVYSLLQDGFGQYRVNNSNGMSDILEVKEKVDGKWSEWSDFSDCTKECSEDLNNHTTYGNRTRTRTCKPPRNGGTECHGDKEETIKCARLPEDIVDRECPSYNEWSNWSSCSKTCKPKIGQAGQRFRNRRCDNKYSDQECDQDEDGRTGTEDMEECNSHIICQEPADVSKWSEWICDQECFFPNKEGENTESRTRTCHDGDPRHAKENCDYVHLREERKGPCRAMNLPDNDVRKIRQCPPLLTVRARTCNGNWDDSDDNVKIALKNGIGDTCSTKYHEDFWASGSVQTWIGDSLGACGDLRPVNDALSAQIQVNTWGGNLHFDDLMVCIIEVRIGRRGRRGASVWKWQMEMENVVNIGDGSWPAGAYNQNSAWITLKKR